MKKYALFFTLAYAVCTVLVGILAHLLEMNSATSLHIASVVASSVYAGARFAKDHKRVPTDQEKSSYAWLSLGAIWVVSIAHAVAVLFVLFPLEEIGEIFSEILSGLGSWEVVGILSVVFLLGSVLSFFVSKYIFSWFVKKTCEEQRKREQAAC